MSAARSPPIGRASRRRSCPKGRATRGTRSARSADAASSSKELIEGDGQRAKSAPRRVVHGVRDRGGDADEADLPEALDAEGIEAVGSADEDDVEVGDVRVHWDQVI